MGYEYWHSTFDVDGRRDSRTSRPTLNEGSHRLKPRHKWPDIRDASHRLKVETLDPFTAQPTLLVDNTTVRFGSYDDLYPYFKAGVYRLNSNATPMKVTLQNLSISAP